MRIYSLKTPKLFWICALIFFTKAYGSDPDSNCWIFEPDCNEKFQSSALLDLRFLNEKEAGQSGFVKSDGQGFKLGDGTPVKFWGVNFTDNCIVAVGHKRLDYLAAHLAKRGVNIVRIHSPIFDRKGNDLTKVDTKLLDDWFYFAAALKKQGIYTYISFYFPSWITSNYGLEGYEKKANPPWIVLFFDPHLQEIYRGWAKVLFNTKNPYTGLTFAQDPSVAVVEIVNEAGYFWGSFSPNDIPDVQLAKLEKKYGAWLVQRYGSLEKALAAWSNAKQGRDDLKIGRMGLIPTPALEKNLSNAGMRSRMSDQVRFLVEDIRNFYANTKQYFRETIGMKSLVSCGNWRTLDARLLEALERYSDTVGDLLDRHGYYFNGQHKGTQPSSAFRVNNGDMFQDRAAVIDPTGPPVQLIDYENFPEFISELGWTNPNRFRAENTFLWSTYGSLQGMDGCCFFAMGEAWKPLSPSNVVPNWPISVPSTLGQFPASALQYRRGDIKEAPVVVHQTLNLNDLYALKGSGKSEVENIDEARAVEIPAEVLQDYNKNRASDNSYHPFTYFVGRILRSFTNKESKQEKMDLTQYIDDKAKTIKSITGEIFWDYGRGFVTVNTKNSQGVTGFLSKAGTIKLGNFTIDSKNEFGSIQVISLDSLPLTDSKKILVQAFTEEHPTGWQVENGKVVNVGKLPLLVKKIEATVAFNSSGSCKATALDPNGYATENVSVKKEGDSLKIALPSDALYTIIER